MNVLLPKLAENGAIQPWKPMKDVEHLIPQFKTGHKERMLCLINKPPTWNIALEAYVLNFSGRVTMPSVKNFQLIDSNDGMCARWEQGKQKQMVENVIIMQFGRVDEHMFNMDITWPLSLFQAYGIAISSFNYR